MKKIILAGLWLLSGSYLFAQTPEDALRYSWNTAGGTARVQALGGASGAIGGEVSTLFSNPANLGFYKTGDAVISGGLNINNNKASYYDGNQKANKTSGFLGTSGVVWGNQSRGNRSVKSTAFGIGVSRLADFNNQIGFYGINPKSAMGDMFAETANTLVAQGKGDHSADPYGADLAYQTYWINKNANGQYYSPAGDIARSSGLYQEGSLRTSGGITEIAIGGGMNLNDKVYLGGTIGLPTLRYEATRTFSEFDQSGNTANEFQYGTFEDYLTTKGMGFNLKLGAVFTPTQNFRIGLAAHTPTWYSLTDKYDAYAIVGSENNPENKGKQENEYRPDNISVYDYWVQTPYKLMGSFTYLFGNVNDVSSQRGLVTADVEYVNYMSNAFRMYDDNGDADKDYFHKLNKSIDDAYKGAVNARLGAELKFNTIMARIGGAYYGNPYKDLAGEKGSLYQGTAGVGYRNHGFFIDLGYIYTAKDDVYYPYRLENKNNFDPAKIQTNGSRVVLTLGVKI